MNRPLDAASILDRTNLRSVVEEDLGPPDRSRKYRCPFHDDHNPSLGISPDGRRFKCWSARCGQAGSAIDYVMLRENVAFIAACKILDPFAAEERRATNRIPPTRSEASPKPIELPAWLDPAWQAEADKLVCLGERNLWSECGLLARLYLDNRGIDGLTAKRFRLGYFPADRWSEPLDVLFRDGKPRRICARRGISIPWLAPDAWYAANEPTPGARWVGVNVRCLGPDDDLANQPAGVPKYQAFAKSERGHGYPYPWLEASQIDPPALLLEGEFDAILAIRLVGHLVHPFSVGGSTQTEIRPRTLAALASCPWWFLAADHDESGAVAVDRWREMDPSRALKIMLPFGKDLTEAYQEGENLVDWIKEELSDRDLLDDRARMVAQPG